MQGRTSLLGLQALLHVGLVLRGHHPLGGGLGIEGLPSQLVGLVILLLRLGKLRSNNVKAGTSYSLVFSSFHAWGSNNIMAGSSYTS